MAGSVTVVRLKHISKFKDRHGHPRAYLRRPGRKPVKLPGAPGSPEFMAAYQAAIAAEPPPPPGPKQPPAGTLDALAASYYRSPAFTDLRASTQATYRRIIEDLRASHGGKPVRLLDPTRIAGLMAEKATHRTAANHRLRILKHLMAHAIESKVLVADPTAGVKRLKHKAKGYATWSEADIAQYEARWPSGTRQRLALALLLYTAQRRSDVVRMGRQHVSGRMIRVRQVKTGTELEIPIHAALAAELAHVPQDQLVFLLTSEGADAKGFTPGGFYNRFIGWCQEAGIAAGLSPHGLRKACARRLAEAGATTHQIAAVTGHRNLAEVELYTRAANQARMAVAGMARIKNKASNPVGRKLPTRRESGG